MKVLYKIVGFCLCIIPMQLCFANIIVVDINGTGDFTTIQAAIDNAVHGDTVLVLPGTYFENINFKGKAITVASQYWADGDTTHINNTIIDGSKPQALIYGSVVTFVSGENRTAILSGFTIISGKGTFWHGIGGFTARIGGGVRCDSSSSPIIENNIVRDNIADMGAGISIGNFSNPIVRNNIIWRNKAHKYSEYYSYGAGGIDIFWDAQPIIINNTIVNNEGLDNCGGVTAVGNANPLILNNIIVNNAGGGVFGSSADVKLFYNDVWNNIPNWYGNTQGIYDVSTIVGGISVDPLFVDPENGDFRLQPGSPCIDAGDPNSPLDPDETRADMGALPYYHPTAVEASEESLTPTSYRLNQNFPNPFNSQTIIEYELSQPVYVRLAIYNALGQKITTVINEMHQAGYFRATWDGKDIFGRTVPSGVYFYRLETEGFTEVRKMLLLQ